MKKELPITNRHGGYFTEHDETFESVDHNENVTEYQNENTQINESSINPTDDYFSSHFLNYPI